MNEEKTQNVTYDDIPKSVLNFFENVNRSDNHNVYYCRTVDMDGNITDEKFGMNLLTDYGFRIMNNDSNRSLSSTGSPDMYIGLSDTEPQLTDTALGALITNSEASGISLLNIRYPLKFNKETNIYSYRNKIMEGYFDYHINNTSGTRYTEPVEIKEIGIGYDASHIYYKSLVYDSNGNKSSITKKPTERLYITVYESKAMNVNVVKNAWKNGIYMFLSPGLYGCRDTNHLFYLGLAPAGGAYKYYYTHQEDDRCYIKYNSHCFGSGYNYASNSYFADHGFDRNFSISVSNPQEVPTIDFSTLVFSDNDDEAMYGCGSINNIRLDTESVFALTNILSDEDEEFEILYGRTDNWRNNSLTGMMWGSPIFYGTDYIRDKKSCGNYMSSARGMLPFAQCQIQEVAMYNNVTGLWDIPVPFVSNPNHVRLNDRWKSFSGNIWVTCPDGVNRVCHVYINPYADCPTDEFCTYAVTSFGTTNYDMYATNEYWDVDTWEKIANPLHVPPELGKKRFYIDLSGTTGGVLNIQHDITTHYLNYDASEVYQLQGFSNVSDLCIRTDIIRPFASDKNGWMVVGRMMLFEKSDGSFHQTLFHYEFTNYEYNNWYTPLHGFQTEDRFLYVEGYCNKSSNDPVVLRIYNMIVNEDEDPTYVDVILRSKCYKFNPSSYRQSFSEKGWYAIQNPNTTNVVRVVDIYGTTNTENPETPYYFDISNTAYSEILNLTDYMVYKRSDISSETVIEIMDLTTQTVVEQFTLPTDTTWTVNNIFGWKNNVYLHVTGNGRSTTYYHEVGRGQESVYDINQDWTNSKFIGRNTGGAVSDENVYICGSITNEANTFIIFDDDPTNFIYLRDQQLTWLDKDDVGNIRYYRRHYYNAPLQLYRSEDNQHYLCLMNHGSYYGYARCTFVIDIGLMMHTRKPLFEYAVGPIEDVSFNAQITSGGNTFYETEQFKCLYKSSMIGASGITNNILNPLYHYPLAYSMNLRIKGITKTITAVNNPFTMTGITLNCKVTNDMSKLLAVEEEV